VISAYTSSSLTSNWAAGKTALIAGGTSGIGLAAAEELAKAGFSRVIINGRDPERGSGATDLLHKIAPGCNVIFEAGDASHIETAQSLVHKAEGKIDLFLNAVPGNMPATLFSEFEMSRLNSLIDVHLGSVFRCCHAVYKCMRALGDGVIINIASDAAKIPTVGETIHGAIMAAIDMFSRTLAVEAARSGIRVHVLTPSIVAETNSYDRMMDGGFSEKLFKRALEKAKLGVVEPHDIAPVIVFLASPLAKKMTGQRITINGGIAID
tara:strand:- start:692 stop:1489 length:798 start_codon:yes stop_codon:yes gene_type:complete